MMQNISGLANLISNAGEKNISILQNTGTGENAFSPAVSFQNHLESAVKQPSVSEKNGDSEIENSYIETRREEEAEKEKARSEMNRKDDMEKENASSVRDHKESVSENKKDPDETGKYQTPAENQKSSSQKKTEKNSDEKSKTASESRFPGKNNIFSDGFMNEFLEKVSKKETGKMNSDLIRNKLKPDDSGKKESAKEASEKSGLRFRDDMKNRDTVMLALDPEKWKIHGRVESKETFVQENQNKKNSISKKDNHKSSSDESGDQKKGQSSAKLNEMKNIFAETGELKNSSIARNQNFADQLKADTKNMFNELVDKARLNLGPDGNSTASIRMNPESLGRLTMNLRVMDNSLEAKILVESESAKKLIMDDIENLKMELRSQGIQVDSFTVKIRESFFSGMDNDPGQQNPFFNGENSDFNQFSQSKDADDSFFNNLTNQISEIIDDGEYGSISYDENVYDGAVNFSV